jgi:hypothetical protein
MTRWWSVGCKCARRGRRPVANLFIHRIGGISIDLRMVAAITRIGDNELLRIGTVRHLAGEEI